MSIVNVFSLVEMSFFHRNVGNNGVSDTRAYNTDNTLASIGNLTYGWDANKNKTSEAIAGTMSNYGFLGIGKIVSRSWLLWHSVG